MDYALSIDTGVPYVDVHRYHRAGDPDWAPAFDAALRAVAGIQGATVIVPPGDYELSTHMDVPPGVTILGFGQPVLRPGPNYHPNPGFIRPGSRSALRGLRITGERHDGTRPLGHLLYMRANPDAPLTDVVIDSCVIDKAFYKSNNDGSDGVILTQVRNILFASCIITDGGRCNVSIEQGDNITFENCFFGGLFHYINVDVEPLGHGVCEQAVDHISFVNCTFDSSRRAASALSDFTLNFARSTKFVTSRFVMAGLRIYSCDGVTLDACRLEGVIRAGKEHPTDTDCREPVKKLIMTNTTLDAITQSEGFLEGFKDSSVVHCTMNALRAPFTDSSITECTILGKSSNSAHLRVRGRTVVRNCNFAAKTPDTAQPSQRAGTIDFSGASGAAFFGNVLRTPHGFARRRWMIEGLDVGNVNYVGNLIDAT